MIRNFWPWPEKGAALKEEHIFPRISCRESQKLQVLISTISNTPEISTKSLPPPTVRIPGPTTLACIRFRLDLRHDRHPIPLPLNTVAVVDARNNLLPKNSGRFGAGFLLWKAIPNCSLNAKPDISAVRSLPPGQPRTPRVHPPAATKFTSVSKRFRYALVRETRGGRATSPANGLSIECPPLSGRNSGPVRERLPQAPVNKLYWPQGYSPGRESRANAQNIWNELIPSAPQAANRLSQVARYSPPRASFFPPLPQ